MPREKRFLKILQDIKWFVVGEDGESHTSLLSICYTSLLKLMNAGGLFFQPIDKLRWYLGVFSKRFLQISKLGLMKLSYLLLLTMGLRLNSKGQTNLILLGEFRPRW